MVHCFSVMLLILLLFLSELTFQGIFPRFIPSLRGYRVFPWALWLPFCAAHLAQRSHALELCGSCHLLHKGVFLFRLFTITLPFLYALGRGVYQSASRWSHLSGHEFNHYIILWPLSHIFLPFSEWQEEFSFLFKILKF